MKNASGQEIGRKDDGGKMRWDLVPYGALEEVVRVLMFGATEYGEWNWTKVDNWRWRYFNAALRHLIAWFWRGETQDPKTGLHHLAHAAVNCIFLIHKDMEPRDFLEPPLKRPYSTEDKQDPKSRVLSGQLAMQTAFEHAAKALVEGRHLDFANECVRAGELAKSIHDAMGTPIDSSQRPRPVEGGW